MWSRVSTFKFRVRRAVKQCYCDGLSLETGNSPKQVDTKVRHIRQKNAYENRPASGAASTCPTPASRIVAGIKSPMACVESRCRAPTAYGRHTHQAIWQVYEPPGPGGGFGTDFIFYLLSFRGKLPLKFDRNILLTSTSASIWFWPPRPSVPTGLQVSAKRPTWRSSMAPSRAKSCTASQERISGHAKDTARTCPSVLAQHRLHVLLGSLDPRR
jgi:hypothetical protein